MLVAVLFVFVIRHLYFLLSNLLFLKLSKVHFQTLITLLTSLYRKLLMFFPKLWQEAENTVMNGTEKNLTNS